MSLTSLSSRALGRLGPIPRFTAEVEGLECGGYRYWPGESEPVWDTYAAQQLIRQGAITVRWWFWTSSPATAPYNRPVDRTIAHAVDQIRALGVGLRRAIETERAEAPRRAAAAARAEAAALAAEVEARRVETLKVEVAELRERLAMLDGDGDALAATLGINPKCEGCGRRHSEPGPLCWRCAADEARG